jgi:hypothetical protein
LEIYAPEKKREKLSIIKTWLTISACSSCEVSCRNGKTPALSPDSPQYSSGTLRVDSEVCVDSSWYKPPLKRPNSTGIKRWCWCSGWESMATRPN